MKIENILFGKRARKEIIKGVKTLSESIKKTIGPRGKNAVIEKIGELPLITNDGATIAKEIYSLNPFESLGLNMFKEIALKSDDLAGDGTTTATIIGESILKQGIKKITKNINSTEFKNEIQKLSNDIIKIMKKEAKKNINKEDIFKIAKISSKDNYIAKMLKEIYIKGAIDGIFIEDSLIDKTYFKIYDGIKINEGYISPYLVNNEKNNEINFQNAYIILYNNKLDNLGCILNLLEKIKSEDKEILIIAKDFDEKVIQTICYNKLRNILKIAAIKIKNFGNYQDEYFEDLSILLNTKLCQNEEELMLLHISELGNTKNIKITKTNTNIIEYNKNTTNIENRKISILKELKREKIKYKKELLKQRLNNFLNKTAVIYVGDVSKLEVTDKKLRLEDAISSINAARTSGVIIGSGLSYIKAFNIYDNKILNNTNIKKYNKIKENKLAYEILKNAIYEPFNQIMINAGQNPKKVLRKIQESNFTKIYNANNLEFEDVINTKIINAVNVDISSLSTAVNISSNILTTEVSIIKSIDNKIEEKE